VGLERGPLSLASTTEALLGRKSSGSGPENREHGRWDALRWHATPSIRKKFALISLTSRGRWTEATEFVLFVMKQDQRNPTGVEIYDWHPNTARTGMLAD
jgi:hypothetical protein